MRGSSLASRCPASPSCTPCPQSPSYTWQMPPPACGGSSCAASCAPPACCPPLYSWGQRFPPSRGGSKPLPAAFPGLASSTAATPPAPSPAVSSPAFIFCASMTWPSPHGVPPASTSRLPSSPSCSPASFPTAPPPRNPTPTAPTPPSPRSSEVATAASSWRLHSRVSALWAPR